MVSGLGEAMAAVFDIRHPLHDVAGVLGVPTVAAGALLIGYSVCRTGPWSAHRKSLLWTAHAIWISLVLFIAAMAVMVWTFHSSGAHVTGPVTRLPPRVIGLAGWGDRLFVVTCCVWMMNIARVGTRRPGVAGTDGRWLANAASRG